MRTSVFSIVEKQRAIIEGDVATELTLMINKSHKNMSEKEKGNLLITMSPEDKKLIFSHKNTIDNSYFQIEVFPMEWTAQGECEMHQFLTSVSSLHTEVCRKNYNNTTLSFAQATDDKMIIFISQEEESFVQDYQSLGLFLFSLSEETRNLHYE